MSEHRNWDFFEHDKAVQIIPKSNRLDFSNSLELEKFLDVFINEQAFSCVIIDLKNVAFMDSCSLGVLIEAHRQLCKKGRLCLCNIHPHIMNLLDMTRLNEVFHIFANCDEIFAPAA